MSFGDLAGDGETEPRPLLGPRGVRPVESFEDEGQLVLGDPNPRIRDRQRHAAILLLHPDRDAPAVRRVLDRVVQENGSYLQYALSVKGGSDFVLDGNKVDRHFATNGVPGSLGSLLPNRTEVVT